MTAPVMIMAGGTGGHVFPALAVAECFQARHIPVVWMGTRRGLEAKLVPQAGIPIEWLAVAGLRGSGVKRLLLAPFMVTAALVRAGAILRRIKPRLVLGMGGFVSGPGGLMSRCLGIPLVLHEQNTVPGMTNRWLARIANRVTEAFPGSFPPARRALAVGNPVRASIAALAAPGERFQTHGGRPRLLVIGGSQGALALNELVPRALALLAENERPEVYHQAGARMQQTAVAAYREVDVVANVQPFIDDMAAAYGWADLVVCRSGALTVAELAAAGVGSILVPFPYAVDDHQTTNARFLEREGAAQVIQQKDLTAAKLAGLLSALLRDRDALLAMAEAAHGLARVDAASRVVTLCLEQERAHG